MPVECVERHLDPLDINLVVADTSRSKTICLAVTPALKSFGLWTSRLFMGRASSKDESTKTKLALNHVLPIIQLV